MNRDLGAALLAFGAMWALDAATLRPRPSRRRKTARNPRPRVQAALDRYATTYCGSLVEIAIEGRVSPETKRKLREQSKRAEALGASAWRLRGVEGWCDREMVPKLKKLYGVDVRRQGELFE